MEIPGQEGTNRPDASGRYASLSGKKRAAELNDGSALARVSKLIDYETRQNGGLEEYSLSSGGLEERHGLVRNVVAWTLGPLALVVTVMSAASFLHVPPQAGIWLAALALLAACVGQCIAITKSQAIGKGQSIAVRTVGFLCTLGSWILLLAWAGWLAMASYYAVHPNAPLPFGGR